MYDRSLLLARAIMLEMARCVVGKRCSEGPVQGTTLERRVHALWMPPTTFMKGSVEVFLNESFLLELLIAENRLVTSASMQSLPWQLRVVDVDVVVGCGPVSLCLLPLLPFGDDHVVSRPMLMT